MTSKTLSLQSMEGLMRILLIAVVFVWCGLVLGISFVATPLKFMAPNMTLELGLGIGQLVFDALNKIEIFFAIVVILSLWILRPKQIPSIALVLVVGIVLFQTFFLLPVLGHRLALILSGSPPPESYYHMIYMIVEIVKVTSLIVGGVLFTRDQL